MPAVCEGVIVLENETAPLKVGVPLNVPDKEAPLIVGVVNVLFVSVSVLARATIVSAPVGSVRVPEFVIEAITGVVSVGEVPNTSAPDPVSFEITPSSSAEVVAANCASVPEVSANVVPQENPLPLVHFSALFAVLQLGAATAVGDATPPVAFAMTVFAATGAREPATTVAHPGGVPAPVDTMA